MSSISYLINYGRIPKAGSNGAMLLNKQDLIQYDHSYYGEREVSWKDALGEDLY